MQLQRGSQASIKMQKDPERFLSTSQKESCWSMGWGGGGLPSYFAASWGHLSSDCVAFVCRMGSWGGESLATGRRDYPPLPFLAQSSAILQSKCEMNI